MKNLALSSALILLLLFVFTSCEHEEILPNEVKSESIERIPEHHKDFQSYDDIPSVSEMPEELKNAPHISDLLDDTPNAQRCNRIDWNVQGPWQGGSGSSYHIKPRSACDEIYAMKISSGNLVNGIAVWYRSSQTGGVYYGGGAGNTNSGSFHFFNSGEAILYADISVGTHVDRVIFYTNQYRRIYHGGRGGRMHQLTAQPAPMQFLGFKGKAGNVLNRMGVHLYTRR